MDTEFPSNSIHQQRSDGPKTSPKAPEKNVQKVIAGKVVRRKKPLGRRFRESFFEGEDSRTAITQVLKEMLIPDTKGLFLDVMNGFFERKLYGEYRGYSRRMGPRMGGPSVIAGPQGYTAYNRMGGNPVRDPMAGPQGQSPRQRRSRDSREIGEIILETRSECIEILNNMHELVSAYQLVTVADLNVLLGEESTYIDARWGWTNLDGADVHRVSGGYLLMLPRPEPID